MKAREFFVKLVFNKKSLTNNLYLTTDSKGLAEAIRSEDADLVLNWKSVNFLPENLNRMAFIDLPAAYVKKQTLGMGLLIYSQLPEIARKIMQLAASAIGQDMFRKYGLQD